MNIVSDRSKTGFDAEELVAKHLENNGFHIIDRNWRKPWGELDIVAEKDKILHFVEVKASNKLSLGFEPFRRADHHKMVKVARTAETWLMSHKYPPDTPRQIDIASVIMNPANPEIEIFENI